MLREQVITPRAGRPAADKQTGKGRGGGGAAAGAAQQQRPATRGKKNGTSRAGSHGLRGVAAYVPLAFKCLLAIGLGLGLFWGYRSASSASFFQARTILVDGAERTSEDSVKAIVRRAVASKGVWNADLAALSAEIKSQPWVRSAVVSRVLPSGLRVRITERQPVLVARTSGGRFVWVDEEAVTLGAANASDKMPSFFVRGLDDAPTDSARAANRDRVAKSLEMTREWQAAGLSERVSEVNLDDLRDVRAQLSGDDSQIEVRLGDKDFTKRLTSAMKVLDGMPAEARATVTYLDAWTRPKSVVVGSSLGTQLRVVASGQATQSEAAGDGSSVSGGGGVAGASGAAENVNANGGTATTARTGRANATREDAGSTAKKKEARAESRDKTAKKEKSKDNTRGGAQTNGRTPAASGGAERPRRAG